MNEFIARVAKVAVADWIKRHIMLPSVVIAQAILESGWGKSELATNANALFGIKKNGWTGAVYVKDAGEQLKDGSYITVKGTEWRAYASWEESILDHNTYIATRDTGNGQLRYAGIIGNTDYATVCKLLKECGYATSLTYPEKLMNIITKYNLTQYDKEVNLVKIAIDAGHGYNTAGKRCMKILDSNQTREWSLNSRIATALQRELSLYDCQVIRTDDITGKTDVGLAERSNKSNEFGADIFISIHHNAGLNGRNGGGTNVYYYGNYYKTQALALYNALVASTGLIGNRADKVINYGYAVLKNTKMPAYLIENGFMDSPQDVPVILTEEHANKTAKGICNFLVKEFKLEFKAGTGAGSNTNTAQTIYRVQCGAYSVKAHAEALQKKLKAAGFEAVIVSGSK